MAHVFQMMAGASNQIQMSTRLPSSARLIEDIDFRPDLTAAARERHSFSTDDLSMKMSSCPVCSGRSLMTLADLGAVPVPGPEDDEIVPNIGIGMTGIVLPDPRQLARWFKVPVPPKFTRSRLHLRAKRDGKQHGTFTFFSTISFETVFFTPNIFTMCVAFTASMIAGVRSWSSVNKLACEEDRGIALELTVRKQAFRARNGAWDRLYYCTECGMVHDRQGKRSLPWYSMLQLVHYPEQEFQSMESQAPENSRAKHAA